jgi:hypothetical protein
MRRRFLKLSAALLAAPVLLSLPACEEEVEDSYPQQQSTPQTPVPEVEIERQPAEPRITPQPQVQPPPAPELEPQTQPGTIQPQPQ